MINYIDLSGTSQATAGTTQIGAKVAPDASLTSPNANCDLSQYEKISVVAQLQGATGGTLDVYLQAFDGVDWVDYAHFAQQAAAAPANSQWLEPQDPSAVSITPVGRNATPALAAAACVGGHPGDRLRVVTVTGSGVTVGAAYLIRLICKKERMYG